MNIPEKCLDEDEHYRRRRIDTPLIFDNYYEDYLLNADNEYDRKKEEENRI